MPTTSQPESPTLPEQRGTTSAPVFVDSSGRRRQLVVQGGRMLAIPAIGYLGLVVSTLLGGPTIDSPLLPLPAAPAQVAGAPQRPSASPEGSTPSGASQGRTPTAGTAAGTDAGGTRGSGATGGATSGGAPGATTSAGATGPAATPSGTAVVTATSSPSAAPSATATASPSASASVTHGKSHSSTAPGASNRPSPKKS